MPLNATDFVPQGPIRSADIKQFVDLFTGVMLDQPITFRNAVTIGGNQGASTAALSLYAATGQTGNLINLYPSPTSLNPTFGFAASGAFGWGPGGTLVQDTFLSRIGTQNGHTTDTPGLLLQPNIEVTGSILADGPINLPSGAYISDGGTGIVQIGTDAAIGRNLYVGFDHAQYFHEVFAGAMGVDPTLLVHGANAQGYGLTAANAHLQVRGDDVPDSGGAWTTCFSAHASVTNWTQFNVKFEKINTGIGWPGVALLLDYDVDNGGNVGGRISMINGRIGLGGVPAYNSGYIVEAFGATYISGILTASGGVTADAAQINHNLNVDTITIDSAVNSGGAKLAFPQTIGPKISLYDAGSGAFFGMGINSGEVYYCVPVSAIMTIREQNSGGAVLASFNPQTSQFIVGQLTGTNQIILDATQNQFTFSSITDPQGSGSSPSYRNIKPSTRPASTYGGGEVQIDLRLYVDGDITAGTWMHADGFLTTSDPNLKSNAVVIADNTCMARVRGNVPVYQYTLPPPSSPGFPQPNSPTMGFMATDMQANSPEFVALDYTGAPASVVYGQMASLLWGALRNLDARCQAHGI